MSSTLTAESKKYAAVAKDLHRQASKVPALCSQCCIVAERARDLDHYDLIWSPI